MDFNDYEGMLKRLKEKLPQSGLEKAVFEIPHITADIQGNKTIVPNFFEVADALNRPREHLLKYLSKELATAGVVEGHRVVFQGKFVSSLLNRKLEVYVREFVLCPQCGRHDTKLSHEDRVWTLKCMACGAKEPMKNV